jgi:hypothetical protein
MLSPEITKPEYGPALLAAGPAYSAVEDDVVFASAGFYQQWEGRAIVWALLSADAGRHFIRIHRAVLRAFSLHPYRRIETAVLDGFEEGYRWAEMLGFWREGLMRAYCPDGTDAHLYARVI